MKYEDVNNGAQQRLEQMRAEQSSSMTPPPRSNKGGGDINVRPTTQVPPRPRPQPGQQPSRMSQSADYKPNGGQGGQQIPPRPNPNGQNARPVPGANAPRPKPNTETPAPKQQQSGTGINKNHIIIGIVGIVVIAIIAMVVFTLKGKGVLGGGEEEATTEASTEMTTEEMSVEPTTVEPVVIAYMYTEEEVKALRAAGYTGDEIEAYQYLEKPAQELLDEAAAEQQAYVDAFIAPLYDETSDKYKANLQNTWLALPERSDVGDFTEYLFVNSETKNLDFEKVPIYGNQVFLKVYLDDVTHSDYFFMLCDPKRYMELGNSGNIVVTYNYIHPKYIDENGLESEDTSRMFILDAREVIVTD